MSEIRERHCAKRSRIAGGDVLSLEGLIEKYVAQSAIGLNQCPGVPGIPSTVF